MIDTFTQEHQKIFTSCWLYAGAASTLPTVGDYFTRQIGGEEVIILKSEDTFYRAYFNVCPHRGAPLCLDTSGHLHKTIQCPYHAWTFDLKGSLLTKHVPVSALTPVALSTWNDLLFISLATDPPPLEEQLQNSPVPNQIPFHEYQFGKLKSVRQEHTTIQANWKILMENELECYHCQPLHPEFSALYTGIRDGIGGFTLANNHEVFSITGKRRYPDLPGLSSLSCRKYYCGVLLPNTILHLFNDHIIITTYMPLDEDSTYNIDEWFFSQDVVDTPNFSAQDAIDLWEIVSQQDLDICERVQRNVHSRAYPTRYQQDALETESLLPDFSRYLATLMGEA